MKTTWLLLDAGESDAFSAFDILPTGCLLVHKGKILAANNSFAESVGVDKKALLLHSDIDKYLSLPSSDLETALHRAAESKQQIKLQLHSHEGASASVLAKVNLQVDADKSQSGYLISLTEASETPSYSQNIVAPDGIFSSVFEFTQSYYVLFDLNDQVKEFNENARKFHKQLLGIDLKKGLHYLDTFNSGEFDFYQKTLAEDQVERKCHFEDKTRGKRYFDIFYKVILDEHGSKVGVLEFGKEVTTAVGHAIENVNAELTLQSLIDSSMDSFVVFNEELDLIYFNKTFVETAKGYLKASPQIGLNYQDVFTDVPGFDKDYEVHKQVMKDGVDVSREFELEVGSKKEYFHNQLSCLKDQEGALIGLVSCTRNVTRDRERTIELEHTNSTLKAVLDSSLDGICALDKNYKVMAYNQTAYGEFLRYAGVDLSVKSGIKGQLDKDEFERWSKEVFGRVLNGESFQNIVRRKEDQKVFRNMYTPVIDGHENIIAALEVSQDITDYVNSKSELQISKDRMKTILDKNPAGIARLDIDGKIKYVSPKGASFFKKKPKEMEGKYAANFLAKEQLPLFNETVIKLINGDESVFVELELRPDQDDGIKTQGIVTLIRKDNGDPEEFFLSFLDITDQLRDKTKLAESQKEIIKSSSIFESLVHNSFDAIDIIKFDIEGEAYVNPKLIVRNEKMKSMIGNHAHKVLDSIEEIMEISPEKQPDGIRSIDRLKESISQTLKTGQSQIEYRLEHEGGRFDVVASQLLVALENDIFFIKNFRDITKEVEARGIINAQIEEAKEKNQELEKYIESNLQLENFAYIASHDLKAPIRSVISFAQLLKNNVYKDLDVKNQRFLDIMITASTNMQVLIDDLLSYSRINTQAIEFENVDLPKLLRHLLIEIGQNIAEKNGEVVINELPESIVADASRIRQVFQNLITNAMKFHREGQTPRVEVSCKELPKAYEFSVSDSGIGIEEKYLSEIFLMFKKLHSENKFKGTGIGLSICKKIVEQHNGAIRAESVLGEGTSIIFTVSKSLEVNI